MYTAVDIITAKRNATELSAEQITWMVNAYTAGDVSDAQFAALAMAIYFHGLSDDELFALTTAMLNSGTTLDFSDLGKPTADKHSTGGVAIKSHCRSPRWLRPTGSPYRNCLVADSATPGAP